MGQFLGHPRGLLVCFTTELWERFSYYGMRALLIYYLTQHFLFSDEQSYAIYGAYTTLAWGLPVIGGILADRYLGQRRAVTIGAVLLASGHLLMAVEGPKAIETLQAGVTVIARDPLHLDLFFLSLALIASGVGFLKSNISTLVGALYAQNDRRRDAGFTIFYLGINIGSAAAPLLCGWLGQKYGWSYGFGLAGLGMLLGLATFLRGQRHLQGLGDPPQPEKLSRKVFLGLNGSTLNYLGALAMVLVAWQLISHQAVLGTVLGGFSAVLGIGILYFSFAHCSPVERDRMLVVLTLIVFAILFWALYELQGSSLNLFSDRLVDRRLLGYEVQASQLQALPAVFVILLAPLFSIAWSALGARNPGSPVKFSLGLAFMGLALLMPAAGAAFVGPDGKIALFWFAMVFFLKVCGELCIAPIALSLVTRLCPRRVVGMMVGSYFLSMSIGSFTASQLAKLTQVETQGGRMVDAAAALSVYVSTYTVFALCALGADALLFALTPVLRARMHDSAASGG